MRYKPKVCIMAASIGNGHVQAARAVAEMVKRHPAGYRAQTLDFLSRDMISPDYWVREAYMKMIDLFPLFYDVLYHQSQSKHGGKQVRSLLARVFRNRMRHLVGILEPDLLAFTHPFPAAAASRLREKGELPVPLVGIVTDFDSHQLWVYRNMDAYCVPTQTVAETLAEKGVPENVIHITGIPIMQHFYTEREKEIAREPGTVMVMGGGIGLGGLKDVLWRLTQVEEIQRFIVVTGYNVTLYDEIEDLRGDLRVPLELYGYTNEIPRLMARASLLVTKPGALTCTEAITMGVPMILVDAIPGQEEANAEYLEGIGCAKWIAREQLVTAVRQFFADSEQWSQHGDLVPLQSAAKIAEIIHQVREKREIR